MNFNIVIRRISEPVLFGSIANIVVNFIMNPVSFKLIPEEFIIAILLFAPITLLNRYVDRRLEERVSWTEHPVKRFTTHLLVVLVWLVILLNSLGYAYMWITQKGFFTWKEIIIIDLVTLSLAVILTLTRWAVHFYRRWVFAEGNASASERIIDDLKQKLIQPVQQIEVQKGTTKIKIEAQAIRIVKIAFGTVRIYSDSGLCGTFPGSLSQLDTLLPEHLFFQVSRDAILHKKVIGRITPSTFGKIMIGLQENYNDEHSFTVSRPKAAAFRKWYNTISA